MFIIIIVVVIIIIIIIKSKPISLITLTPYKKSSSNVDKLSKAAKTHNLFAETNE